MTALLQTTRIALTTAALLLFVGAAPSQAQTTQPKLEYLMTYKALLELPQVIDPTLLIVNVLPGGWAKGPNISGSFIPPGGDWLRVMPSGALRLDVRATMKTDDGELIYISYNGIIQHTDASIAKVNNGQVFTNKDVVDSTDHCNTAWSLSAGARNPKVLRGR